MGGLSRRAYIISQLLENTDSPTLFVDSGNLLFKNTIKKKIQFQDRLTAQAIQRMYRLMNYTAIAVGPRDLLDGVPGILKGFLEGTPWISANLLSLEGAPLFPPWVIHESENFKIGVIGLTGQVENPHETFQVVPWHRVLPDAVDKLSPSCDFIILLSNMDDEANRAIAAEFPEIQLLISAVQKIGNMVPAIHNNTLITQTHTRGKHFGSLDIEWTGIPFWKDVSQAKDILKRSLLESSRKRQTTSFDVKQQGLIQTIEQMDDGDISEGGGSFRYRFRALTLNIPESPEIKAVADDLKKNISRKNLSLLQEKWQPGITDNFVGSSVCKQCHKDQWGFWSSTGHASAYNTLEHKNQQYNLNCLSCHVTRQTKDVEDSGRTYLLSLPAELRSVGCEMCHGSALLHSEDGEHIESLNEITEKTCLLCHTGDMGTAFDFTEKSKTITCPSP